MFGESESESPRVPSPWDSLAPSPSPSPPPPSHQILPRLPPESDLGNVEYKLQLLSPSTSRFTRLVTQLKWRLLEGGGQAYYELGVSDSGLLVGLTRDDLETSLETLEMMAGEIGASVIVVKEVEVPGRMAEIARKQEDYRRRVSRGSPDGGFHIGSADSNTSVTSISATETETDETGTGTEQEESASASPALKPAIASDTTDLFIMDPDTDSEPPTNAATLVSLSLEISSVFKPRPFRTRVQLSPLNPHSHTRRRDAKKDKWKEKETKQTRWREKNKDKESDWNKKEDEDDSNWKSANRRVARDRRREEKRRVLVAAVNESLAAREVEDQVEDDVNSTVAAATESPMSSASDPIDPIPIEVPTISLTTPTSVDPLTTATTSTSLLPEESPFLLTLSDLSTEEPDDDADDADIFPTPSLPHKHFVMAQSTSMYTPLSASEGFLTKDTGPEVGIVLPNPKEGPTGTLQVRVPVPGAKYASDEDADADAAADPRYIVEALVVRKMSLEEAFLDFGGFSVMADM